MGSLTIKKSAFKTAQELVEISQLPKVNKHEFVIALDISSSNSGIVMWDLADNSYKAFAIDTKPSNFVQKKWVQIMGKDTKIIVDSSIIEINIQKFLSLMLKDYIDKRRADSKLVEGKEGTTVHTPIPQPFIVHIVPERPFVPFGEKMKFSGSNKTSIYYGLILQSLVTNLHLISGGTLVPFIKPIMPNTWKSFFNIKGSNKPQSIIKAKELGLETANDNIAEAFLIGNCYIQKFYSETVQKYKQLSRSIRTYDFKNAKSKSTKS